MAVVLVDFDTHGGRDFAVVKPIGVWVTRDDGGLDVRYLPEVEDANDPGHDNYMRTLMMLEPFLNAWRSGGGVQDFRSHLIYLAETSYLGFTFRTIAEIDVGADEAYDRFVVKQEPLPVQEEFARV